MRWKHRDYKESEWGIWFCWHPIILADTGEICWLEFICRKQIPYHFKYRKVHYMDHTPRKQWWIYAYEPNNIEFWNEWEYEII